MSIQGVMGHQLGRNLSRQLALQPAADINGRQFRVLEFGLGGEFPAFPLQIGHLRVGLRTDRHVFAGSPRHGACDQTSHASDQDGVPAGRGRGDTDDEACRGDDAVVGAQDRGTKPPDSMGAVVFVVEHYRTGKKQGGAAHGCCKKERFAVPGLAGQVLGLLAQ